MSVPSEETHEPGSKNEPGSELRYDAREAAAFYDEYGEREWTRFDDMKMYRWRELRELLEANGEVVAASATGLVTTAVEEPELRALAERIELDVGAEPGAIDIGHHILAVMQV